jgi:hypothetical protein
VPAGLAFFRPTRLKVLFVAEWLLFLLLQGVRGSLEGWAWTRLALAPLALFYLAGCGLEACSHQSQRVAAPRGLLALALALAGLDQMFKALVAAGLPLRAFAPLVPGWLHLAHEPNVYGSWLVAQLEPASPGLLLTVQAAAVALFLVSCVVGHRIYLRTYRFSLWADVACVGLSAGLASWIADALGRGYILDYIALPGLVTTDRKDVWLTLSVAALSAEVLDNPQLSGRWAVWRRSRQSDARLSEGPPDAGHQARFHSTPHTEGMPMSNVPQVPATWGTLEALGPLSAEQIEAEARKLLAEMTLAEKVHQMSGDTLARCRRAKTSGWASRASASAMGRAVW